MIKHFFMVYSEVNSGRLKRYDDAADAIDEAKRQAVHGDAYVLEPTFFCKQPVPDIDALSVPRVGPPQRLTGSRHGALDPPGVSAVERDHAAARSVKLSAGGVAVRRDSSGEGGSK